MAERPASVHCTAKFHKDCNDKRSGCLQQYTHLCEIHDKHTRCLRLLERIDEIEIGGQGHAVCFILSLCICSTGKSVNPSFVNFPRSTHSHMKARIALTCRAPEASCGSSVVQSLVGENSLRKPFQAIQFQNGPEGHMVTWSACPCCVHTPDSSCQLDLQAFLGSLNCMLRPILQQYADSQEVPILL